MSTGKVLLALLAGAAAGALAGVLLAPHKGIITRKKIVRNSGAFADGVKEKINDFLDDIAEKFESTKEDVSEFAEQKMQKNGEAKKQAKAT